MKEVSTIIKELKNLEALRGGVPTYVYFGGIGGKNLVMTRRNLMEAPTTEKEIDILLESAGGSADDAYRLIRTFREKYETVNIIVPFWAKSAATLFAFGASKLVLHEFGEMGPIDVQIKKDVETDPEGEWSSAVNVQASLLQIEARSREGMLEMFNRLRSNKKENEEVLKIKRTQLAQMLLDYSAKFYEPLLQKVDTLELGKMARSLDVGKMYARRILKQYTNTDDDKITKLINFLTYECPDHGYVVDYKVLRNYLPYVIKSTEQPFGPDYDKELEKLSIHLMTADDDDGDIIGFLRDLTPKPQTVTIKSEDEHQSKESVKSDPAQPKGQDFSGGGLGDRPSQDESKRNPAGGDKNS